MDGSSGRYLRYGGNAGDGHVVLGQVHCTLLVFFVAGSLILDPLGEVSFLQKEGRFAAVFVATHGWYSAALAGFEGQVGVADRKEAPRCGRHLAVEKLFNRRQQRISAKPIRFVVGDRRLEKALDVQVPLVVLADKLVKAVQLQLFFPRPVLPAPGFAMPAVFAAHNPFLGGSGGALYVAHLFFRMVDIMAFLKYFVMSLDAMSVMLLVPDRSSLTVRSSWAP